MSRSKSLKHLTDPDFSDYQRRIYGQLCLLNEQLHGFIKDVTRLQRVGAPLVIDVAALSQQLNLVRALQQELVGKPILVSQADTQES